MADQIKHIFLTGSIQVGKSTILKSIIEDHPELKTGGIITRWINRSAMTKAGLYLFPADRKTLETVWSACSSDKEESILSEKKIISSDNLVASFDPKNYRKKLVQKEVFNNLGKYYLKKARNADLILIDEIGIMEEKSYAYQETLLSVLDGNVPVIGVVRNKPGILTDAVRNHPSVQLFEVTKQNRESLKQEIADFLDQQLKLTHPDN